MSLTTCATYSSECSSSREQLPCNVLEYLVTSNQNKNKAMLPAGRNQR